MSVWVSVVVVVVVVVVVFVVVVVLLLLLLFGRLAVPPVPALSRPLTSWLELLSETPWYKEKKENRID